MSSTTVCMTDESVVPFPVLDSSTQVSNTAASPLSHMPCRNARSNASLSDASASNSNASNSPDCADYALQNRSATHVRYDSGSSSSSSTPSDEIPPTIIPRSKRISPQPFTAVSSQDLIAPDTPVSTPVKLRSGWRSFAGPESRKQTPLRDMSDEEDTLRPFPVFRQAPFSKMGKIRLEGSGGKHARHASDSSCQASALGTADVSQPPQTIKKKSGQPVKSSLKSSRRPELRVVTGGSFAKSEPVTPTHTKAVHFDTKLEHVKLFLAEQKPLAVSRDGSPTSDTSGDEFPPFIYGDGGREDHHVKMLIPNMPPSPRIQGPVALQGLVLSQEQRTIIGTIRVRNIAYEKWLAIRFTMDWWQTTSEVTARYDKSIENGVCDIFTFAIRLHDIWSRIEEKTIFLAVRYAVAGQEYWDNNAGNNFHVKFVLDSPSKSSNAVSNEVGLRHLKWRLEGIAKARSAPAPVIPYRLGRSHSADHQYSSFAQPSDFASPHKTQLVKHAPPSPNHHTRTHTYPSSVPTVVKSSVVPRPDVLKAQETGTIVQVNTPSRPRSPLPTFSLGSPQEVADRTPTPPTHSEATASLDGPGSSRLQDGRERNHRRGYTDRVMEESPTLRRTPTSSPLGHNLTSKDSASQLPRTRSYPLAGQKLESLESPLHQPTPKPPLSIHIAPIGDEGSEGFSQSSSTSTSSTTPLFSPGSDTPRNDTSYKQFLDQFCFYTGVESLFHDYSSETLPRSHSASSIERFLLSHSPPQSFAAHNLPTRFPFDSGSSTPTAVRV